jgi:hypothetical protein
VDIKTVKASMESSRVAPKRRAEPESSNAKAAPAKKLKKPRAPKLRGGGLKLLMQEQLIQPGVGVRASVRDRAMRAVASPVTSGEVGGDSTCLGGLSCGRMDGRVTYT